MNNNDKHYLRKNVILCIALIVAAVVGSLMFSDNAAQFTLACIGLVFMIVSRIIQTMNVNKKERCSYTTSATVIGHSENTDSDGHTAYYPVYTYTFAGNEYTVTSSVSDSTRQKHAGEEIDIFLNPDDPEDSYIAEYQKSVKVLRRAFQIIGVILLDAGAATLFL